MVLVFFIFFFIILAVIVLLASTISLNVEKLHISNLNSNNKLKYNYDVYFEILFLNKLKILSIKIDKKMIKKFQLKNKIENIDMEKAKQDLPNKKEAKELIKKLKIQLEKFQLNVKLGTKDVIITSSIIAIISSILGILLSRTIKKYDKNKYSYSIYPLYQNKNIIKIKLNCIIKVKVVHIIFIIYLLLKKRRVNKNERASNRRAYDYSYE